jgi:hypothetical protein
VFARRQLKHHGGARTKCTPKHIMWTHDDVDIVITVWKSSDRAMSTGSTRSEATSTHTSTVSTTFPSSRDPGPNHGGRHSPTAPTLCFSSFSSSSSHLKDFRRLRVRYPSVTLRDRTNSSSVSRRLQYRSRACSRTVRHVRV